MAGPERQLHFNAFLMSCGHHEAAWRLPESDPSASLDLSYWTNLARIAERGTFDSVFLADGPALWGHARFRPGGALEPTVLLTALAGATSRIGLIATASTSYNHPYNLARRFASLDHVSGGRAGWNIVTTATAAAAQNFGLDDNPAHAERYRRAAEFTDVSIRLWTAGRTARRSATRRRGSTPTTAASTRSTTRASSSRSAGRSTCPGRPRAARCWSRRARRTTAGSSPPAAAPARGIPHRVHRADPARALRDSPAGKRVHRGQAGSPG